MKTSKYLSLLLLASVIFACKDKTEPQPDWASRFEGSYELSLLYDDRFHHYFIRMLAVLERIDEKTLKMNCISRYYGQDVVDGNFIISTATSNKLPNPMITTPYRVEVNATIQDSTGVIILTLDSLVITKNYRDSIPALLLKETTQYGVFSSYFRSNGSKKEGGMYKVSNDTKPFSYFTVIYPYYGTGFPQVKKIEQNTLGFAAFVDAIRYEWSFGDNTTASGDNIRHTYAQKGIYKVKLTVTYQSGQKDSFERKVEVLGYY